MAYMKTTRKFHALLMRMRFNARKSGFLSICHTKHWYLRCVRLWTRLQGLCKQLQPFLWVQKVTRGHITAHSEGFFKNWSFLGPFLVKIDPKLTFSLNLGAFFSGRVQNGFETQNGFTRSTFRGMPSFVPKFAFLVVENGLRNPPIWEFF